MKKLLGISLLALFAAAPILANAATGDRDVNLIKLNAGSVEPSSVFATTSYVDGAYKITADKIDLLIDDTAVEANGNYIDKGKSVSANLGKLDTNLKTVSDTVSGHEITLETLTGDENTNGSVAKQIAVAMSGVADKAGNLNNLTTEHTDSLVNAVNDVNAAVGTNAQAIQTINNTTISYVSDWSNPTIVTKSIFDLD